MIAVVAPAIDAAVAFVRAAVRNQDGVAAERLQQPRFTDGRTGRNVGRDELLALAYLRGVGVDADVADGGDPVAYLERVLREVRAAKQRFVAEEEDVDGFGAGTFSEIIASLENRLATEL